MALGIGPEFEEFTRAGDAHVAHLVHRHAVRQVDRGLHDFTERFGSELAQCEQPGVHHAGHERGHHACDWNHAFESTGIDLQDLASFQRTLAIEVRCRELWHGADAGDRIDFAGFGADENGCFAAESEVRVLAHRSREHCGDASVHGVSALVEEPHAGFGGSFRACADCAARAPGRVFRGHLGLFSLARTKCRYADQQNRNPSKTVTANNVFGGNLLVFRCWPASRTLFATHYQILQYG